MEENFRVEIEFDGQTVKADCQVRLGRFCDITMTAPYQGIKNEVAAYEEEGNIRQFYDREEAQDYARKDLKTTMGYIRHVNEYRSEYAEASQYFKIRHSKLMSEFRASEASKKRGCLLIQSRIWQTVMSEYHEMVYRLIPSVNTQTIIHPLLLEQILILT